MKVFEYNNLHKNYIFYFLKLFNQNSNEFSDKMLPSLLLISGILLDPKNISIDEINILRSFLENSNQRVKDNTIEALGQLQQNEDLKELEKIANDGRTLANIYIALGKIELEEFIVKGLTRLLNDNDENKILSGLYAVELIFEHFRTSDKISFSTNINFKEIFNNLKQLENNSLASVNKKASDLVLKFKNEIKS